MELTLDFRELLELFEAKEVKYLVVGGYAVNHYGYPRYTEDLDLWIWMNSVNASRVIEALREFGFSSIQIVTEDFLASDNIVQLGYPPNRIDLMTSTDGLKFEDAYQRRNELERENLIIPFIGLQDLIRNKKTTARLQDLADAENLIKIHNLEDE